MDVCEGLGAVVTRVVKIYWGCHGHEIFTYGAPTAHEGTWGTYTVHGQSRDGPFEVVDASFLGN